jgi:hypothetical protein
VLGYRAVLVVQHRQELSKEVLLEAMCNGLAHVLAERPAAHPALYRTQEILGHGHADLTRTSTGVGRLVVEPDGDPAHRDLDAGRKGAGASEHVDQSSEIDRG